MPGWGTRVAAFPGRFADPPPNGYPVRQDKILTNRMVIVFIVYPGPFFSTHRLPVTATLSREENKAAVLEFIFSR